MLSEQQQDGHLIYYPAANPIGRSKLLLHVNGVSSTYASQLRDIEALVWLTLNYSFDIVGIHNSTEGFRTDIIECLLGKAELFRFWSEHQTSESQERLRGYADILAVLTAHDLAPDTDIIQEVQRLRPDVASHSKKPFFDLELIQQLPFLQKTSWSEFEFYFYGAYPAGAPKPTLRLAYEILRGIKAGCEVFVVAHSQGMIIAAIAFHILHTFFGSYGKWTEMIRFIGYGPAIMFEDLPPNLGAQTVMIQHRQDLVAESFSNIRNINLWSNVQTQFTNALARAEELARVINHNSHHSASFYLGIAGGESSDRSAQLISLLLGEDWKTSPAIQSLRASRIIIEVASTETLARREST
ncbi:MAG TPA: hypothetical protein V6D03_06250 [Candidatus Caenarcaniphilales bacterium]